MREGLEAFNALVDKVLAYRPKQKIKKVRKAKTARRQRAKPKRGGT